MAIIDTVRVLIRDSGTSHRFTDSDLERTIQFAIDEVNAWAETVYVLQDYEDKSVGFKYQQLMFLVCKIWAVQMDLEDTARYIKFVTQDVQYDAGEVATRMNRMLYMLQQDLQFKLKKWIGLDVCGYVAADTEFQEVTNA